VWQAHATRRLNLPDFSRAFGRCNPLNTQKRRRSDGESAYRRDSVQPLRACVAIHLCGLPGDCSLSRAGGQPMSHAWPCSGWGLPSRSSHLDRWCALTAPFHPYLCGPESAIGGLFSVALSFESPRLVHHQHPALWSPDLPRPGLARLPERPEPRPPGRLTVATILPVRRDVSVGWA
jgi:hypothetical protein